MFAEGFARQLDVFDSVLPPKGVTPTLLLAWFALREQECLETPLFWEKARTVGCDIIGAAS
jgi:hypothetical protein